MADHQPLDVDWLAFRYVAGEMTDDERDAWEIRLADDQAAREAVAAAYELTQAVAALPPSVWECGSPVAAAPSPLAGRATSAAAPRSSRSPIAWWASAAAALLAAVVGWNVWDRASSPAPSFDANVEPDRELALLWSRTRHSRPGSLIDSTVETPSSDMAEDVGDATTDAADVATLDSPPDDSPDGALDSPAARPLGVAPSWMLSAVSGMVERAGDDRSSDRSTPTGEL